MSSCPSPTGISRGSFDEIWTALRVRGTGSRLEFTSTQNKASSAEAIYTSRGNLRGSKCILIRTLKTNKNAAYIYPCCWGYSLSHSGTRIGHYWPRLKAKLRLVGKPEDDQTTQDRNLKHAGKPAEGVRSRRTSPGRVDAPSALRSLSEIQQILEESDPSPVGINEQASKIGSPLSMDPRISTRIDDLVRNF